MKLSNMVTLEQIALMRHQHAAAIISADPSIGAKTALAKVDELLALSFDLTSLRNGLRSAAIRMMVPTDLADLPLRVSGGAVEALSNETDSSD